MITLDRRQWNVITYIKRYKEQHGYGPTCREICHACDFSSTSVVVFVLNQLVELGLLIRPRFISRAFWFTDKQYGFVP